jgi:hypothetical protein
VWCLARRNSLAGVFEVVFNGYSPHKPVNLPKNSLIASYIHFEDGRSMALIPIVVANV